MTISLSDAGKRYNREWIYRHVNFQFLSGHAYAITGSNGSGKSTLLQSIAGILSLNEGTISYSLDEKLIKPENFYTQVSFCAPYLELVEEMSLIEFLVFHQQCKGFLPGNSVPQIISAIDLEKARDKEIRNFSSGMKQRLRLAQCIFSNTPVLLLDEPCTNLDAAGMDTYQELIKNYRQNRIVIVSSNDEMEYAFCDEKINIADFKK